MEVVRMFFALDDKKTDCIMINTTQRGEITYFLHEKAYAINNSAHCHVQGVSWDVVASKTGTIHYSVTMYYKKDSEDAELKKSSDGYLKSNKIWFESVDGHSRADFEENLQEKLRLLKNVHFVTQKAFEVNGKIQYFAIITHSDDSHK